MKIQRGPGIRTVSLPGPPYMIHYQYWFSYPFFKSTDKISVWVSGTVWV